VDPGEMAVLSLLDSPGQNKDRDRKLLMRVEWVKCLQCDGFLAFFSDLFGE
jgi:hypothetical protein